MQAALERAPPTTAWKFRIGQSIRHGDCQIEAIITWRGRLDADEELYGMVEACGRTRFFNGSALLPA